jgi:hypothetical protein
VEVVQDVALVVEVEVVQVVVSRRLPCILLNLDIYFPPIAVVS